MSNTTFPAPQTGWKPLWQAPYYATTDGRFLTDPDEWQAALRDDVRSLAPQEFEPSINVSGLQASITAGVLSTHIGPDAVSVRLNGNRRGNLYALLSWNSLQRAIAHARDKIKEVERIEPTTNLAYAKSQDLELLAECLPDTSSERAEIERAVAAASNSFANVIASALQTAVDAAIADEMVDAVAWHTNFLGAFFQSRKLGFELAVQSGAAQILTRASALAPFKPMSLEQWLPAFSSGWKYWSDPLSRRDAEFIMLSSLYVAPGGQPQVSAEQEYDKILKWMLEYTKKNALPKRDTAISDCMTELGCTWRAAIAAWKILPSDLKRNSRQTKRALKTS